MIVILSGGFVSESIRSELGDIPWSLVPLANKPLFQLQITSFQASFPEESICLILPASFNLMASDIRWLDKANVQLMNVEKNLSVGKQLESFLANAVIEKMERLVFIDGSSFASLDGLSEKDWKIIHDTDCEPSLPVHSYGVGKDTVWSGIACVGNIRKFLKILTSEGYNLYRALITYSFEFPLSVFEATKMLSVSNAACYLDSRTRVTSERAFNRIDILGHQLRKISSQSEKINAEAEWYAGLPFNFRHCCPQFLGIGFDGDVSWYSIEYLAGTPLNEVFVHGKQTIVYWDKVFTRLSLVLQQGRDACPVNHVIQDGANNWSLFAGKTKVRLQEFSETSGVSLDTELTINGIRVPSINEICDELANYAEKIPVIAALVHGDLCFSNIIYDNRLRSIKLIDPRGVDARGEPMLFGSQVYDYAKLLHSVVGLYDHIMAEKYILSATMNDYRLEILFAEDLPDIQNRFRSYELIPGISAFQVEVLLPLLFFAMLPLHSDSKNRQNALLANALRLYAQNKKVN